MLEALRSDGVVNEIFLGSCSRTVRQSVQAAADARGVTVRPRSDAFLQTLLAARDEPLRTAPERHQGVVATAPVVPLLSLEVLLANALPFPIFLLLDQITDPHNLGAIIRSAVGFGADGVVLPERRSAQVTATVTRISAGATAHARIAVVTNLARTIEQLGRAQVETVGLCSDAPEDIRILAEPPAAAGRALVVGSEGKGIRRLVRARCDRLVRIPMDGPLQSFNAAVAASLALYEAQLGRATARAREARNTLGAKS